MDDCRGWRHQTTLPDDREQNEKGWIEEAVYFQCTMTQVCLYGREGETHVRKEKKKMRSRKKGEGQAGKMECGIENVSEELEGVRWENEMEKEKGETDVTEERGKKPG